MRKSDMRTQVEKTMKRLKVRPSHWGMSPEDKPLIVEVFIGVDKHVINLPHGLTQMEFQSRMNQLKERLHADDR